MLPSIVLCDLRVLVVEDEMMVALLIEDVLLEQRCTVVGPYGQLGDALAAARTAALDLAVLDVNIIGGRVYPVAEVLQQRRIPFVFLSGYGQNAVPREHPEWKVCSKPFRPMDLVTMLVRQMNSHEARVPALAAARESD